MPAGMCEGAHMCHLMWLRLAAHTSHLGLKQWGDG